MFNRFFNPTLKETVQKELSLALRKLHEVQNQKEYYESMEDYYKKRIERLQKTVQPIR